MYNIIVLRSYNHSNTRYSINRNNRYSINSTHSYIICK